MIEARYYIKKSNNTVQCQLCPHHCVIKDGGCGICMIRKNISGVLYQTSYGEVTSLNIDPIEKKPLYHFYPGRTILSIGTNGCNLSCSYCQNFTISKNITNRSKVTIDELLGIAIESKSIGIAYTYNEPTIWYEFVFDCAERFHDKKLKNVLVTNGYINKKPLEEIVNFIDAANVDLKGFTEDKYRLLGGSLKPVLNTIEFLINKGVHVEITHLAVPNYTSDYDDFRELCKWLSNLNRDIPIHISRYFTTYKLNLPPTSIDFLEHLYEIAKSCLSYVYLGNIPYKNDSYCPYCGAVLVKRMGYSVECFMGDSRCPYCGKDLYFLL